MKRIVSAALAALLLAGPVALCAQTNDAAPLPTLASLLPRAAEVAQKESYYESAFNQHYHYDRSRVTEIRYTNGKLKGREAKNNTNRPTFEEAARPLPAFDPAHPNQRSGNDLINIVELTTNVLAHSQLSLLRREMFNGRATLIVDFKPPDEKLDEDSQVDRLINRVSGRGWVDEEDCTLVRLEGSISEKLSFFAGLGAVLRGSYSFERARTEEGVWYAREVKWNAKVREFIVYRVFDYHEENTNVRRAPTSASALTTQ